MSEAKFTPGPWEVKDDKDWNEIVILGKPSLPFGELRVAVIGQEEEEGFADAALIAAAPDMYAALEAWEEAYDNIKSQLGDGRLYNEKGFPVNVGTLNSAQSFGELSLSKARGES